MQTQICFHSSRRRWWWIGVPLAFAAVSSGCSLSDLVKVDDPEIGRILDRDAVTSRVGAIGLYHSALGTLQEAVSKTSLQVARLTDEATSVPWSSPESDRVSSDYAIDARAGGTDLFGNKLPIFAAYTSIQAARIRSQQARGALRRLNDSTLSALIANTYALEGYSILLLAENGCSGIPLTDVPFDGDVIYSPGYSTTDLFTIASSKFDSALSITHDSGRYVTLARIGKGRAELGLGNYARAAEAVALVGQTEVYQLRYTDQAAPGGISATEAFWTTTTSKKATSLQLPNGEGQNGMVWYEDPTHIDPRLPVTTVVSGGITQFPAVVRQRKFLNGNVTFSLARWVEAQLIRAEHSLNLGSSDWLEPLNEARRSVGLSDTTDPGTVEGRVSLLFRERAFWFFMEGVRLADYRRLVRQYSRDPYLVYPVGPYTQSDGSIASYGDAWVLSPAIEEQNNNYRYQGCQHGRP